MIANEITLHKSSKKQHANGFYGKSDKLCIQYKNWYMIANEITLHKSTHDIAVNNYISLMMIKIS